MSRRGRLVVAGAPSSYPTRLPAHFASSAGLEMTGRPANTGNQHTNSKGARNHEQHLNTHTHIRLMALCPELPRWAGTRKANPIWILLKQETVSGSGISWAIYKSASRSRQITMPAPHHSVFYRPDALPADQPTVSKHWRHHLSNISKALQIQQDYFIAVPYSRAKETN